jgi:hypothetical protein
VPGRPALFALHPAPEENTKEIIVVLLVYLLKYFDTVNHDLIFKVLLKCWIPEELVGVVRRLYADFKVKVKVGKEERYTENITRVQQGNNVASYSS